MIMMETTKPLHPAIQFVIPALVLLIHLYTNVFAGYGIFRDELYYIACANRLDIGYVDQPMFSILFLALWKTLFGASVIAIRFVPAVLTSLTVWLSGRIAKEMGAGAYGVLLATMGAGASIILLAFGSIYSMNAFDLVFWATTAYLLVRLIKTERPSLWYWIGIVIGLGVINKLSMLWYGAGIGLGVFLTNERVWLKRKEPYLAVIIVLLFALPYVIWNFTHDYATLEFIHNASTIKYGGVTAVDFLGGQLLLQNPLSFVLWFSGLLFLLVIKEGSQYRILGFAFLAVVALLLINGHSKPEYLAAGYAPLFAAGGVALETWLGDRRKWIAIVYAGFIGVSGAVLLPMIVPILPVEGFIRYQNMLGMKPSSNEREELSELPQFYADMFGWEELAKKTSEIYQTLPPEEQKKAIILAQNYGQAGAIEYFSSKYPLPPVIAFHNNYWWWAYDQIKDWKYETVIILRGNEEGHRRACDEVVRAGVHSTKYAMPYENNFPIYICRKIKASLMDVWKSERHYM
jgi:hypothetical protein